MGSLISLKYPNGRIHEVTLATETEVKPGDRFDLYGRSWNAVRLTSPRGRFEGQPRVLCLPSIDAREEDVRFAR